MRTPNSNLATPLIERAEMAVVHNQPKRKCNRKMVRFIAERRYAKLSGGWNLPFYGQQRYILKQC